MPAKKVLEMRVARVGVENIGERMIFCGGEFGADLGGAGDCLRPAGVEPNALAKVGPLGPCPGVGRRAAEKVVSQHSYPTLRS